MVAIFENQYAGDLSGAVWIADTAANRRRFEQAIGLHPNSALFSKENYDAHQIALCQTIWSIQDHFPDLEMITVIGVEPNASIAAALLDDFEIEPVGFGFRCRPTNGS